MELAYQILGKDKFYRSKSENNSKIFRRSIFVVKNIKKGDSFNISNIRRIRPGNGLSPKYYEKLMTKKSLVNLKAGEPLTRKAFK